MNDWRTPTYAARPHRWWETLGLTVGLALWFAGVVAVLECWGP